MAGSGVRLFLSGDIAYASDLNTYFMDQVVARFPTTAARDAAFGDGIPVSLGGNGKPALSEGRICYIDELNLIQFYDGVQWQDSDQFTVADGTITNAKLAANSVTSDKIAPGTVIAADISAGTITATELADGAVTSAKILDGTIVNADINNSAAIAHSKLANITAGSVLIGNSSNVPTATALSGDVTVTSSGVTAIGSGVIVNADINASASIALSKLAPGTSGQIIVANSSGVPTWVSESGDVTISDTGVTAISSGVIVDADVNASAAIAHSKLANITAGRVLMGNASNVPTATALSGDVTVTSSGVTAIGSGVIVDADVNASAAIAYSKLNLSGSITSSDIVDGTIVNGDISSTAAIERGKIADLSIDTKTANYSLVLGDKNKVIEMNVGSANTVTVPLNSAHAFPIGSQVTITQYGVGKTQVVATGGVTVRATPGSYLRAQYSTATLIKRATDEWYLIGDLSLT